MNALILGLIAAFAWGIHDVLVGYVSRTIGIIRSIFIVLIFGGIIWLAVTLILGDFENITIQGIVLSIGAGVCFSIAMVGHYNAFAKGPIRIVAPVIGTFAVVAFAIAALMGKEITILQWSAVLFLVVGIGLVANQQNNQAVEYNITKLLLWCIIAVFGFAFTFALGQEASSSNDPIVGGLITRITATFIISLIYIYSRVRLPTKKLHLSMKQWCILALIGSLDAIALGVVLAAGIYPNAEYASAASSIFGLITVLIAWVVLKEKINKTQWTGILITFISIAFLASQ